MHAFARVLIPVLFLGVACMKAPMSERIQPYSGESPTTGPAGVPGSGGTGAAGSFGSGGTIAGTTTQGPQGKPSSESVSPKAPIVFIDGGAMH
jgi:hypothetical protein